MNIKPDKIGSVLKNVAFQEFVSFVPAVNAIEGEAVLVQAIDVQKKYGELELVCGRLSKIREGDLIAGTLGERKALEGIVGVIPANIKKGDILHILNLGGVIGKAVSWNKDKVAHPLQVKVLGSPVMDGKTVNIHHFSLPPQIKLNGNLPPIVVIAGTSMGVGKTTVATELVHLLAHQKLKVGAAKLTGVATQRDILAMKDAGASQTLTFHDVGLTSTLNSHDGVVPAARTIINSLGKTCDILVIELGDGIIGWYGVEKLLKDDEFIKAVSFTVVCAHDLMGAVGSLEILKKYGLQVEYFAGPVANNTAGTDYLEQILKVPSADVRDNKSKLMAELIKKGVIKHD